MVKTQISVQMCGSYDIEEVHKAVIESVNAIGGPESFIKNGDRVLIKPNMLQAKSPEEAITTHPSVIEAVIKMVQDCGAVPLVGDSPGGPARGMEIFWEATGFLDVATKTGAKLVNFEKTGSYKKKRNERDYWIAKKALDVDLIINVPKIKSHGLTVFTCAVKNIYGVVPGLIKTGYHKDAPSPIKFAEYVVDIYALAKPQLTIVDGVIGMDGTGPSSGNPKELGMILASQDGVALDCFLCKILGKDPMDVPINRIAVEQNIGEGDLERIEILGTVPVIKDFNWPPNIGGTIDKIPAWVASAIMKFYWSRPAIDTEICNKCSTCIKSCPVDALIEKTDFPEFEYGKCINCLCCMEMCPEKAVYEEKSPVSRIISKFSG